MKVQTQVSAKITLTAEDMRQAVADYISNNGFEVKASDLPDDFEDRELVFTAVEDSSPNVLKNKTAATPKRASKPKEDPKPVVEEAAAKPVSKAQEVIGTQVPDIEVALYRQKKAEEAAAKAAEEAKLKEEAEAKVKAEAAANAFVQETVEASAAEPSDAHADSLDDDDDDLVEEGEVTTVQEKPAAVKTKDIFADDEVREVKKTKSIFDTDDEPQTASDKLEAVEQRPIAKKATENLFA